MASKFYQKVKKIRVESTKKNESKTRKGLWKPSYNLFREVT